MTGSTAEHTFTYNVVDRGGNLVATLDSAQSTGGNVFTNTYAATGEQGLTGSKNITGRDFEQDDNFTFQVEGSGKASADEGAAVIDAPKPSGVDDNWQLTINPTQGSSAQVPFGTVTFTQPGVYTYTFTEVEGDLPGVTYDTAEHTVVFTVTDTGLGQLDIEVTDGNLTDAVTWTNRYFPTYVVNSVLTGLMSTSIRMVVAFLASYAFSHFRFKGDSACLAFIILTLFIPSDLLLSGNYMTIQKLGLLDTYAGIISTSLLPASQILMLRQYFRSIPGSIRDSAMMDGCSDERYILSILLPISRALVSTFLLQGFVGMFNSYLWPLLVTNSPSMRTVQIGITMLGYAESLDYGPVFAAIVVVTVPFVVAFILMRRRIMAALSRGYMFM